MGKWRQGQILKLALRHEPGVQHLVAAKVERGFWKYAFVYRRMLIRTEAGEVIGGRGSIAVDGWGGTHMKGSEALDILWKCYDRLWLIYSKVRYDAGP